MFQGDVEFFDALLPKLKSAESLLVSCKQCLKVKDSSRTFWNIVSNIVNEIKNVQAQIKASGNPDMKCRALEWTDAGPGVGVTNHDVKCRMAQLFRIINADYLIRLHLSNGDSSQNEVERT